MRLSVATGRNARLAYPSALDELRDETWFHRFTDAELATALNRECPDMAELARGEETKWRDWVNANHAASEQLVDAPHEP
ncbi:MAG: hypothetical protein ABI542_09980 [Gemmatimonadota bacterium]